MLCNYEYENVVEFIGYMFSAIFLFDETIKLQSVKIILISELNVILRYLSELLIYIYVNINNVELK